MHRGNLRSTSVRPAPPPPQTDQPQRAQCADEYPQADEVDPHIEHRLAVDRVDRLMDHLEMCHRNLEGRHASILGCADFGCCHGTQDRLQPRSRRQRQADMWPSSSASAGRHRCREIVALPTPWLTAGAPRTSTPTATSTRCMSPAPTRIAGSSPNSASRSSPRAARSTARRSARWSSATPSDSPRCAPRSATSRASS